MDKGLYLVATPIGNLEDITLRAINTLKSVDVIACEDTRHSRILLEHYGINKRLISCYKEKEMKAGDEIIALIREGKSVALITDAGMPCVSDPGAIVVDKVRKEGFYVTSIPGASACVTALSLTGIAARSFTFLGFFPEKKKEREDVLARYADVDSTLIFYSSPYDINDDISDMYAHFGKRRVFMIKELTKLYESVEEGFLDSLRVENPRGEYVVVVEGKDDTSDNFTDMTAEEHYKVNLMKYMNKKEAIKATARERGVPKDEIYKAVLDMERD